MQASSILGIFLNACVRTTNAISYAALYGALVCTLQPHGAHAQKQAPQVARTNGSFLLFDEHGKASVRGAFRGAIQTLDCARPASFNTFQMLGVAKKAKVFVVAEGVDKTSSSLSSCSDGTIKIRAELARAGRAQAETESFVGVLSRTPETTNRWTALLRQVKGKQILVLNNLQVNVTKAEVEQTVGRGLARAGGGGGNSSVSSRTSGNIPVPGRGDGGVHDQLTTCMMQQPYGNAVSPSEILGKASNFGTNDEKPTVTCAVSQATLRTVAVSWCTGESLGSLCSLFPQFSGVVGACVRAMGPGAPTSQCQLARTQFPCTFMYRNELYASSFGTLDEARGLVCLHATRVT